MQIAVISDFYFFFINADIKYKNLLKQKSTTLLSK